MRYFENGTAEDRTHAKVLCGREGKVILLEHIFRFYVPTPILCRTSLTKDICSEEEKKGSLLATRGICSANTEGSFATRGFCIADAEGYIHDKVMGAHT